MLRILVILAGLMATPALATEWVNCSDREGQASFDFLSGDGLGVLSIVGLTITSGERVWANGEAYGPGDPATIGQQFEDDTTLRVDALDKDAVKFAELRLFKASEGEDTVYAGTLRIVGMGAWAVSCTGQ
jgi:hypothetical protein